jgi:methionine-rich copper-binding protein CopC
MHIDMWALSVLSAFSPLAIRLYLSRGAVDRSVKKWDDRGELPDTRCLMTRGTMKLRKRIAYAVLAFIASVLLAGPASANSLVSTSPVAGATVNSTPSSITLNTQDVVMDTGNSVTVTDPQGARVDDGTLTVNATTIVAGLKLMKVSGVYTVAYSLLTNNDVPLQGTFTFTYNAPSVISSASPSVISPSATPSEAPASSGLGVPALIVGLIFAVVAVFLFLVFYTWKLIKKK